MNPTVDSLRQTVVDLGLRYKTIIYSDDDRCDKVDKNGKTCFFQVTLLSGLKVWIFHPDHMHYVEAAASELDMDMLHIREVPCSFFTAS